jgi:hypothetical protein
LGSPDHFADHYGGSMRRGHSPTVPLPDDCNVAMHAVGERQQVTMN